MLDSALSMCLDRAIEQVGARCRQSAPASAQALVDWTWRLSPTGRARDYFDGGRAIMFLLPWWLEQRVRANPDVDFHELLTESTVNAYYFVRLIDNVLDENAAEERDLLPLLGILHANFYRAYTRLFPAADPFWDYFDRYWDGTMEAALRDKRLGEISSNDFTGIVARKTSGIKIPLAAVCCRYGRLDLLEPWCAFYDTLACWQQMLDDTFDWMRDLQHGNSTFFLSEGNRQKRAGESIAGWVVRGGFAWAIDRLSSMMQDARGCAAQLESPALLRFLEYRDAEVREYAARLTQPLKEVAVVANLFEPIDDRPPAPRRGRRG